MWSGSWELHLEMSLAVWKTQVGDIQPRRLVADCPGAIWLVLPCLDKKSICTVFCQEVSLFVKLNNGNRTIITKQIQLSESNFPCILLVFKYFSYELRFLFALFCLVC